MKNGFKKWLELHKGKPLDSETIEMIARRLEDEVGQFMYDNGLIFESVNSGNKIVYGECEKDDKNWSVQTGWWDGWKEYKTLSNAVKYADN